MKATVIIAGITLSLLACNARNADNPSNSAPSSDTTTYIEPDMTTGEPVTYQLDTMSINSADTTQ